MINIAIGEQNAFNRTVTKTGWMQLRIILDLSANIRRSV